MSRVSNSPLVAARGGLAAVASALVLAACGSATSTAVVQRVGGVPSISLSVPLSVVACTTTNTCVAVGTSVTSVGPTSVGEVRAPTGGWKVIATPSADPSATLTSSSCWNSGCLFGGLTSTGDLFWHYDESSQSVSAVTTPPHSLGVKGVSCYASLSCAAVDTLHNDVARFLTTTDGGVTWTPQSHLVMNAGAQVSAFTCASELSCMVVGSLQHGVVVYVTNDGGTTWVTRTTDPTSTWSQLTSLDCQRTDCVALADLRSGWHVVRTHNFGTSWRRGGAVQALSYLACSSINTCVAAGQKDQTSGAAWIATVDSSNVAPLPLNYVPSRIISVSCGKKICAAIANTTVMALRP